jgi:hypothetical protein
MKIILTAAALAAFALAPAYAAEDSMKMEAKPAGSMAMSGDAKMDGMAMKPAKKSRKTMAAKPMADDKMKDDTMKMDGTKH